MARGTILEEIEKHRKIEEEMGEYERIRTERLFKENGSVKHEWVSKDCVECALRKADTFLKRNLKRGKDINRLKQFVRVSIFDTLEEAKAGLHNEETPNTLIIKLD